MRWICWRILQSVSPTEKASKFNMFTMGYLHVICSVVAANPTTYDWIIVIKQPVLEPPAKHPTLATYRHIITHDKSTNTTTHGWIVRCFLLFVGWKYIFNTTYDWAFAAKQLVLESPAKRPTLATHEHIIARDKNTTVATCGWIVRCFLLFVGWKYVFTQPMIECMATFLHKNTS